MQKLELGKGMVKLKQNLLQQVEQVRNNIRILWGCNHNQTNQKVIKIGKIFMFYYLKPWQS